VRELEEDGWKLVRGANEIPRAKRKAPNPLEAAFGKLVADTIVGLKKAKSTAEDARVWKRAIAAYGKLKVKCGGNADENLVHFFAVDGIALEARHPVVVQAVAASDERKNFWLKTLEKP
jgi:hypothetical protein